MAQALFDAGAIVFMGLMVLTVVMALIGGFLSSIEGQEKESLQGCGCLIVVVLIVAFFLYF